MSILGKTHPYMTFHTLDIHRKGRMSRDYGRPSLLFDVSAVGSPRIAVVDLHWMAPFVAQQILVPRCGTRTSRYQASIILGQ